MKKNVYSSGVSRKSDKDEEKTEYKRGSLYGGLFALGVVAICASIVIPLGTKKDTLESAPRDAVAVMSTENEIPASTEEENSIFELIGNALADFINGLK